MAFEKRFDTSNKCDKCGQVNAFYVLETRAVPEGRRRRRKCASCGYRNTYYEIEKEAYERLKNSEKMLMQLRSIILGDAAAASILAPVGDESEPTETIHSQYCQNCLQCCDNTCSLGLPEFNTTDADDCTYFLPSQKA